MKKLFLMGVVIASTIAAFADFPVVIPTPVQKAVIVKAVEQAKVYTDKAVNGVSSNVVEATAKAEAAAAKAESSAGQIGTLSNDVAVAVAKADAASTKVDEVAGTVGSLSNEVALATGKADLACAMAASADTNATKANNKLTGISGTVANAIAMAKNEVKAGVAVVSNEVETVKASVTAVEAKADGAVAEVGAVKTQVETLSNEVAGVDAKITAAKNEAIEFSGNAADAKISAKVGPLLGTVKEYVDSTERRVDEITDNKIGALSNRVDQAVAAAETSINSLDNRMDSAEGSIESLGTFAMMAMPKTSYVVYANDAVIPVGPCADLGGDVTVEIPVGMTEAITIRSTYTKANIDVFIDWGDGSAVSRCKDVDPVVQDIDDNRYTMEHTYAAAGKYRVTVYGYRYVTLMHNTTDSSKNLLCSCFGIEDEVAPNLDNVASFANNCPRLVTLKVNGWRMFLIRNIANTFQNCKNLTSITYCTPQDVSRSCAGIFQGCANLKTTDFRLAQNLANPQSITKAFYGCNNLEADIAALLPKGGFSAPSVDVNSLFFNCAKLTGTVPADILWDNTKIKWLNTANTFSGCSDAIRAQVPVSWGGTKSE